MQKTVVRNPNQSPIRRNLLNIAGIVVQGETITPQNGDRLLGGYGVAWLNNQDAASQTTGQDNPLPECNCESGGGGGGGSGGGGGGVQPSGNCEKKNISELKQVLDDYANQSFCDKEFPEVQFSTFIGYDKPPSDSTAKEIELRMLCPVDECQSDDPKEKIGDDTCWFISTDWSKQRGCSDQCLCPDRLYEGRRLSYNAGVALFNQLKEEYMALYNSYLNNSCLYQSCLNLEDIKVEHDSLEVIDEKGNCRGVLSYLIYRSTSGTLNSACTKISVYIRAEYGNSPMCNDL